MECLIKLKIIIDWFEKNKFNIFDLRYLYFLIEKSLDL